MSRKRVVVRTRFEAFLYWMTRDDEEPVQRSLDEARRLYDGFGCDQWPEEMFLRMVMFR